MAKTGLPNFDLKVMSPWRGIQHQWSVASSHSGSVLSAGTDVTDLMQALWTIFSSFIGVYWMGNDDVFCAGYSYYNGTSSAAIQEEEFLTSADATAAGYSQTAFGSAYTGDGQPMAPETCVRLQAPVGLSSTGKPVFLRKFIHMAQGPGLAPVISDEGVSNAAALGNGSLPFTRVLTSPGGKQGDWEVYTYFANHQMQRAAKKKKTSSSGSSLLAQILASAAGTAAVETFLETIAL